MVKGRANDNLLGLVRAAKEEEGKWETRATKVS